MLAKECIDARIEMKTLHDSVWVPFARQTQRDFADAREVIGATLPSLRADSINDDSVLVRRLLRHHAFMQTSKPVLLPPPVAPGALVQSTPPTAAPLAAPPGVVQPRAPRPPAAAVTLFNPAFPNQPGFQALPSPKLPHNPTIMVDCRGWGASKCQFGTMCRFKHAGY